MTTQETATLARKLALREGLTAEAAIQKALDQVLENQPDDPVAEELTRTKLQHQVLAYGALQPLLDDESIEEVWVNGPGQVFIARHGITSKTDVSLSAVELRVIIERMLRPTGRRLDRSAPFVDASLEDGSRLHVVIPDITREHWSVNIRKFPNRILNLTDLELQGVISEEQRQILTQAISNNQNILVSGATQSGKTTLLCALLAESPVTQRIISVEETFELRIDQPDFVGLQTRQPNLEGIGEVTLRRLIKEALRMRPDRLIVGEVREAESLDLLIALNSGLPGACTIHANSAAEAIAKLCTLPLLAGQNISSDFVNPTVGNCIDLVVHCKLNPDGRRVVSEILNVGWDENAKRISLGAVQQ